MSRTLLLVALAAADTKPEYEMTTYFGKLVEAAS